MINAMPYLGAKLKQIRAKMGWAQEDLAREIGVSLSTVQRWEKPSAKPNRLARKALARLFKALEREGQRAEILKSVEQTANKKQKLIPRGKK
jgi:transcriptional regulator with XRE-family HTH domain